MNRKKIISLLFILIITALGMCIFASSSFAANGIEDRINALKSKYPDGYFWNHQVTTNSNNGDQLLARGDESYSESVTTTPCKTHNGTAYIGQYDCNYFDGGIQCFGFARRVFYDIFGVRVSGMPQRYDSGNIQVGDCIRINNDKHSAVVIARNGNTLTLVEANLDLSGPAYNCKIRWGATCSISDVTYFHRASNYDAVNNTNWKDSAVQTDLGTKFYGVIYNTERNKVLTEESNTNVAMYTYTGAKNQIWYFTKNSDGSYRIANCNSGNSLDVQGGSSDSWVNVLTYSANDTNAQKWRFYGNSPYMFISADCNAGVLDVADAKYDDGTNICIHSKTGHNAQLFKVEKVNNPNPVTKPGKTSSLKATSSADSVKLTWSKVSGATGYRIYQYDYSKSSYSRLATTTGTTYTVKNLKPAKQCKFAVKAYKKVDSNYYWSNSYTTVVTATKPERVTGVKATPSTTSVKLSWNKVTGATGYYIFTYNSSTKKYTTVGKTTSSSYNVTGLSKGKSYNFAVQAYSTIGGKNYWGKVSSIVKVTTKTGTSTTAKPGQVVINTVVPDTTEVNMYWDHVDGATGYYVFEYIPSTGKYDTLGKVAGNGCRIYGLSSNTTYYFAVQAYKTVNEKNVYGKVSSVVKVVTE